MISEGWVMGNREEGSAGRGVGQGWLVENSLQTEIDGGHASGRRGQEKIQKSESKVGSFQGFSRKGLSRCQSHANRCSSPTLQADLIPAPGGPDQPSMGKRLQLPTPRLARVCLRAGDGDSCISRSSVPVYVRRAGLQAGRVSGTLDDAIAK